MKYLFIILSLVLINPIVSAQIEDEFIAEDVEAREINDPAPEVLEAYKMINRSRDVSLERGEGFLRLVWYKWQMGEKIYTYEDLKPVYPENPLNEWYFSTKGERMVYQSHFSSCERNTNILSRGIVEYVMEDTRPFNESCGVTLPEPEPTRRREVNFCCHKYETRGDGSRLCVSWGTPPCELDVVE